MYKRLFIAIELSQDAKDFLGELVLKLKHANSQVPAKWVNADMHITLEFLGKINEIYLPKISDLIKKAVEKNKKSYFSLNKIDIFFQEQDRGVLKAQIIFADQSLYNLQTELRKYLQQNGFATDNRKWQPHITLARVKNTQNLMNNIKIGVNNFLVQLIILVESKLSPNGPEYKILEKFNFK